MRAFQVLLVLSLAGFALTSCEFEGLEGGGGEGGEYESDDAPRLGSSHPGYQSACCLDCHDSSGHRAGVQPYQCANCHGTNGAPARPHEDESNCMGCHGTGVDDAPIAHTCDAGQYPDPSSCDACHGGSSGSTSGGGEGEGEGGDD